MPKIAYFVHDVNDPAVARRVRMFRHAGAEVVLIGFRRREQAPDEIEGAPVCHLGQTADAKLVQRALSVIRQLLRPKTYLEAAAGADIIIGRNLEALAIAARARRSNSSARLVYECLDIHRTLLGSSPANRAVQALETALLRRLDLLIVSSPAFSREYFSRRPTLRAPVLLVENKLLELDGAPDLPLPAPPGPPWTIGWFGNLRCARTFDLLSAAAHTMGGRLKVLIAGRPSPAIFENFAEAVAANPHMTYAGPYRPADLPLLYQRCHFAWAIDYFEEGLNSSWLLPNRLYEASRFGVVPIALQAVETGRWLAARGAGLLLDDEPSRSLTRHLEAMDEEAYRALRAAVLAIPPADLVATPQHCRHLLEAVAGYE